MCVLATQAVVEILNVSHNQCISPHKGQSSTVYSQHEAVILLPEDCVPSGGATDIPQAQHGITYPRQALRQTFGQFFHPNVSDTAYQRFPYERSLIMTHVSLVQIKVVMCLKQVTTVQRLGTLGLFEYSNTPIDEARVQTVWIVNVDGAECCCRQQTCTCLARASID